MSRIELRATDSIVVDLPCDRSWAEPPTGNIGSCTFYVPKTSPAYSNVFIRGQGLSQVTVHDDGAGPWNGFITGLEYDAFGVKVTAQQPWVILGSRLVRAAETYTSVLPGYLAYQALSDALPGVRGLSVSASSFDANGGPIVAGYQLNRQTCWQVLTDMMDASDQELSINESTGAVTWGGMFANASAYATPLIAGGSLLDMQYSVNPLARLAEVTTTSGDSELTVTRGDVARDGWPAQTALAADSLGSLALDAYALLDSAAEPAITISGTVGPEHFAIRGRMFVTVFARVEFTTKRLACRVLARSKGASDTRMGLTLQVIPETVVQRLAPATRSTRANVRGRGTIAGEIRWLRNAVRSGT